MFGVYKKFTFTNLGSFLLWFELLRHESRPRTWCFLQIQVPVYLNAPERSSLHGRLHTSNRKHALKHSPASGVKKKSDKNLHGKWHWDSCKVFLKNLAGNLLIQHVCICSILYFSFTSHESTPKRHHALAPFKAATILRIKYVFLLFVCFLSYLLSLLAHIIYIFSIKILNTVSYSIAYKGHTCHRTLIETGIRSFYEAIKRNQMQRFSPMPYSSCSRLLQNDHYGNQG